MKWSDCLLQYVFWNVQTDCLMFINMHVCVATIKLTVILSIIE